MATSLGYKINKNPIAQSFFIDEPNGIYCTKIDLYFAAKDSSFPVQLQIRPMRNGSPSSEEIIPGTQVIVSGGSVNVSADASAATTFTFVEPVFLKGLTDYAMVITADSIDYKIFIARINEYTVGSTERRVDKQPVLGSLFYSQNSVTWSPSQNEDLTFKLYQAKFNYTSGAATFHNASLPKRLLDVNPITTVGSSSTVTVKQKNHGFVIGDKVDISGVGASGVGGIRQSSLVGLRSITAVDPTGYRFVADSAADSDVIGGGSGVLATKNIPYSIIYPHAQYLVPGSTTVNAGVKTTSGKSYAGTDVAYQKDAIFNFMTLNKNNISNRANIIANDASETLELGSGVKSLDMTINMQTADSNVSPMIDAQRMSMTAIGYDIDKQDSSATVGFNVPFNFVNETSPTGGSSASKHITSPVTLAEDAVGIKVLLTANRPAATDFEVYYKIAASDEILNDINWVLMPEQTANPSDENPFVYRQYQYLAGGPGGGLSAFTQMQIKIVFRSTNSAKTAAIKDLRVIALGV